MQTYASALASTPVVSGQTATVAPPASTAPRQRTVYASNRHRQAKLQLADTLLGRVSGPTSGSAGNGVGASAAKEQTNSLQRVVSRSLASPGRPLDPKVQHVMEQRFDYDFSRVRLHDDHRAAAMARLLGATAFTVGSDIGLQESVQLETPTGRRTLAHELAHVRQSRGQKPSRSKSVVVKGQAEEEAKLAAQQVTQGLIVRSPLSHTLGIFCERDPRLGEILQELPFRISLYRRGFPGESPDQLAEFVIRYLGNAHIDLQDRDNRFPVLDVVRAQLGDEAANRFLDRLENAARAAVEIGQLRQQEAMRRMMGVQRTPGLVLPILMRPLVTVTAGVPAFFAGMAEGYSSLGSEDAQRFIRLVPTFIQNAPIVFAGITYGMDRAIITQAIDLVRLLTSLERMRAAANALLQLLLSANAEDLAREMGRHIGAEHVAEIRQMLNSRGVLAAFRLGAILGPILLAICLTLLSFGAAAGGARGARMAGQLARTERLRLLVERLYLRYPRLAEVADVLRSPVRRLRGLATGALERRAHYTLNRAAVTGRVATVAGRTFPLLTNAEMLAYVTRLANHSLIRAIREAYRDLRRLAPNHPRFRVRAQRRVRQLQELFARRTGLVVREQAIANVVDASGAVEAQWTRGIRIRTIEEGSGQVGAVLVEPGLATDPVRHFFELAHDIATYVAQSGGSENPRLIESVAALQRLQQLGLTDAALLQYLDGAHAGRILEMSIYYDATLQLVVDNMAQRPYQMVRSYAGAFGGQGTYVVTSRFPTSPPPLP